MHATVHAVFAATARRTPGAEFLFTESVTAAAYGIPAGAIRWGEASAAVERLRSAYAAAGYGHGHRVGLLLENRPAFLLHWFALNALGASVVPINAEMRSAELIYLIGQTGTSWTNEGVKVVNGRTGENVTAAYGGSQGVKGIERGPHSGLNSIFPHSPNAELLYTIPEVRRLVELSSVDGALILDLHGSLLQVGSMVLSHADAPNRFGTRETAAFSAAKNGAVAFKVSADGAMSLFFTSPEFTNGEVHRFDFW